LLLDRIPVDPSLEQEDINACLRFAAQLMGHQYSILNLA
jgi:uncharacterized protein (DUF433 family)